ncbi:glycoside hydrolase family 3 protein [Gephyromycinifex aptenodytis]|uniref:glycoside hydrolase family 3 protein n=1 Tax=Gephyromycinifex aptenodytis TaxID=2716227 RepID=UPI0014463B86|nr:glycoside hydrolase family 3 N-terminal domain-containing protein [Gephyromycinifex aptenodytis]
MKTTRRIAFAAAVALGAAGCTGAAPTAQGTSGAPSATPRSSAASPATTPAASPTVPRLSQAQRRRAAADVAPLSTAALAAQLVVPDLGSIDAGAAATVRQQGYGGVVVMRNALPAGPAAAGAAKAGNARISAAVTASGRRWPAFVAVDQEGGTVTRLDAPLTQFPGAMALGAAGSAGLAAKVGRASGAELRGLGFTVVMAPDADVTIGAADPTIGVRSPGSDPALVSRIAAGYVRGYRQSGILPVVKHFPGHGSVRGDTHTGLARQDADLAALTKRDLVPFRDAVKAGAPAVMTAHVILDAVDRQRPASLSRAVTTDLLRDKLGYQGLIVTDALNMGAITEGIGAGEAAVRALEAGADVLLMPADPAAAVSAIEDAVTTGRISRSRLEASAALMVATLRANVAAVPKDSAPGSHGNIAREVATSSLTQISGRCGRRLVGRSITPSGGTAADRAALAAAAKRAGLRVNDTGTTVALLGGGVYRAGSARSSGATSATADVLVALDVPYGLASSKGVKIAAYGRTPATFTAVVDVLLGRSRAPGALPVAVGSVQAGAGCGR